MKIYLILLRTNLSVVEETRHCKPPASLSHHSPSAVTLSLKQMQVLCYCVYFSEALSLAQISLFSTQENDRNGNKDSVRPFKK